MFEMAEFAPLRACTFPKRGDDEGEVQGDDNLPVG
jgi:hypothetical protein